MINSFRLLLLGILSLCFTINSLASKEKTEVFSNGKSKVYFDIDFAKLNHYLIRYQYINCCSTTKDNASSKDFQDYFKKITGGKLPLSAKPGLIPISAKILSPDNFAKLKVKLSPQGCIIDVSEKGITLSASNSLGIVNGLYTILDYWGCRWVLPGKIGEVIPAKDKLSLPLGRRIFRGGMDSRIDHKMWRGEDNYVWCRRNRRASKHWLTPHHAWLYFISPKRYYKKHPEYFALIGGKRTPTQLCITNPKVRKLMVKKAFDFFKKFPTADSFPMDPADSFDHCQCKSCKKLDNPGEKWDGYPSVTNRVVYFANYVAERIAEKYPDKKVGFYAYANKKLPPTIKMNKNIFVAYTRDSSCLIHLMPDEKVASSKEYWDLLKKWQKACSVISAYEYDPISWTGYLPCPTYIERAKAIKKQYNMGIISVVNDTGKLALATNFVNFYMEVRFMTDPSLIPKKELADMCNKFFGQAGKAMNKYYLTLAKVTDCKEDIRFGIAGYDRIFTPKMIEYSRKYLNQALAIGEKTDNKMLHKRLKMVNLSQNYLEKYMQFIWNLKKHNYKLSQKDSDMILKAIDALAKEDKSYIEPKDAKRRMTTAIKKNMAKIYPDEMGFIRNWKVIGLFDNNKRDGVIIAKPLTCKNSEFYINNKQFKARNYLSPEGFIDFREAFKNEIKANNVYYAYAVTTVNSTTPQIVQFRTDSFNPFKIWLNGHSVYSRIKLDADCPDKRKVAVKLQAGKNRIVVMVAQNVLSPLMRWGFWFRITNNSGKLIDLRKTARISKKDTIAIKTALQQAKNGKSRNLIPYPTFDNLSSLKASTFKLWPRSMNSQVSLDKTRAHSGKTSVKFINIKNGSLNRFFNVAPGEKYLVGFDCFNGENGICEIKIAWRGKGKFLESSLNTSFFPSGKNKWEQVAGIVTVPQNADQLVYCVAVSGQGEKDSCFVDNLMLYKLK